MTNLPVWIRDVLQKFESRSAPHTEVDIAESLEAARSKRDDAGEQDREIYLREYSVFMLRDSPRSEANPWGTYFSARWNDSGTGVAIPDLDALDAGTIAYWAEQGEATSNPMMKARYFDAAWDLSRKIANVRPDHKMARKAADSYRLLAESGLNTSPFCPIHWLERALDLSQSVRDSIRARQAIESMLRLADVEYLPKRIGLWLKLVDDLFVAGALVTHDEKEQLVTKLEQMLVRLVSDSDELEPYSAESIGDRLVRHYKGLARREDVVRVLVTVGSAFERSVAGDPRLASGRLQPVIERYEQEGLKAEAEALQVKMAAAQAEAAEQMGTFSFTQTITIEELDAMCDPIIVDGDLSLTLRRLAIQFVPDIENVRIAVEQMNAEGSIFDIIPMVIVNDTGREIAVANSDGDEDARLYYCLGQMVSLNEMFFSLISKRIWTQFCTSPENVIEYLYGSSAFPGQRRSILKAGLQAYFDGDYLKAIHVLVPQMEEALRNLPSLHHVPSFRTSGRTPHITEIKSMTSMLEDERVRTSLTEGVWRYLTWLYVDTRGRNLRNKLSHGLLEFEDFDEFTANLVLLSFLRLRVAASD